MNNLIVYLLFQRMAESRENSILKSFFMATALADIARYSLKQYSNLLLLCRALLVSFCFSEICEMFENSIEQTDMSDSEEEDDVLEVSILIDECRSLVEVASFPFFV